MWMIPLLLAVAPAFESCGDGCEYLDAQFRFYETGEDIQTCWGQSDINDHEIWWDFQVLQFPGGVLPSQESLGIDESGANGTVYCHTWRAPGAGLWSIRVRSCNLDGCSRWSDAWNPDHTAPGLDLPVVWTVKLQSASGGTIE